MANEDKDLSSIDAMPDPDAKPTASSQGDALATAIQTTGTRIGSDDGKTPEDVAADAAAAATATRNLAANAVVVGDAVRILKAAAAAWEKNAPKKADFDAAEKDLADARKQMSDAAEASGDTSAASKRVEDALTHLRKITAERKAADEAFDREWKKAAAKLAALTRTAHGDDAPATGTQSTGSGSGTGNPAARTTGTDKPTGTPAATPGSGKPAETTTSSATPTSKPDPGIASLLSSLNQQSAAQQPQQTAAAQPAAAQPVQAAQQPQQNQQGQNKKQEGVIDLEDIARELGETPGAVFAGLGGAHGSPSASSPTPAAQQNSTALRPEFKPAPLAAAPAAQVTGTSATGLTTPSDTTGRSTPTPGAFDSPKTATSAAATDTAAQQQAGQQQTGRPMGSGMPGMMPLAPGAAGPSYGSPVIRDDKGRITGYGNNPQSLILNGGYAVDESVKGGTICQALNQENQDLIRV